MRIGAPAKKWYATEENLKVGDSVWILDKDNNQGKWPTGRVTAVFPGSDGMVRTAEIQSEEKKRLRPVVQLFKIND